MLWMRSHKSVFSKYTIIEHSPLIFRQVIFVNIFLTLLLLFLVFMVCFCKTRYDVSIKK